MLTLALIGCGQECSVEVYRNGSKIGCYEHPYEAFGYLVSGDTVKIKKGAYRIGGDQ